VSTTRLTWGCFLPHGGADEFIGWSGPDAWARMRDSAVTLDAEGYDHLWMSDHLMASGGDRSGPYFESYTAMSALSQVTKHARLGALVTCALYRSPGLLAKQAANVDVASGGRLILGLGSGWDEDECLRYGYDFPSPGARVTAFSETLEAVVRLWSEPSVDFDGSYVHLRDARCFPQPTQRPPIWTGTHGPRGLRATAKHADVANWNVDLEQFRNLNTALDAACAEVGRDPSSVGRSVFRLLDLSDGAESTRRLLATQGAPEEAFDGFRGQHFIGSVDEVARHVQGFVDAGARHVVVLSLDGGSSDETAIRFLREVVPLVQIKAAASA